MKRSLIVLIDFFPHTVTQLQLAEVWCATMQAGLLLVHHLDVMIPAMADQQLRAELAASEKEQINEQAFNKILFMFRDTIKEVKFLTVFFSEEEKKRCSAYPAKLAQKYAAITQISTELFEGQDAFTQLKSYLGNHPEGLLLLQKRARSLTDHLARRFLINALMYDATLPLIILPS